MVVETRKIYLMNWQGLTHWRKSLEKKRKARIETYISIEKQMKEVKNEDENDVLFYRYVKGLRFWEIAEIMGYSEQWIHKLHGRALWHLKLPT